jgi:peroxiredoxin
VGRGVLVAIVAIVTAVAQQVAAADAFRDLDLIRPARRPAAPGFAVPGLGGERLVLHELRGTVVFVNCWATWCPSCKEEMPAMERLYRRYKAHGFTIVAISIDTAEPEAVRGFAKALGLTFPIGLDPTLEIANRYTVRALPSTFLVDRQGHTAAIALGPRDWDGTAAHAVIESLLR